MKSVELPSFFGTQSTPNVNFFIWTTRYSGKEEKRDVLQRKMTRNVEKLKEVQLINAIVFILKT